MANRNPKNHNQTNIFLNNYFDAILAGVLVLFLVLAYFLVLGPKLAATQEAIQVKVNDEQNLYASSQRKLAGLKAIQAIYAQISPADLQRFNNFLPGPYPPERLYGDLAEIVSQGGWSIGSLTIIPPEQPSQTTTAATTTLSVINDRNLHAINLDLKVTAIDYAGLKALLRLLETNLRLFDVTGIQFSPTQNTAELYLTTYYYQAPNS